MKKSSFFRKIIFAAIILAVVSVFVYRVYAQRTEDETVEQKAPKTVSLVEVSEYQKTDAMIKSIGKVESLQQVDLKGQLSAQVKNVYVELGDQVNAGDLLVELDHGDFDAQLAQASAAIARMQGTVDQRLAGATDQEISISEANVNMAKVVLENAQSNLELSKKTAEQSVKNAELMVDKAKIALNQQDTQSDTNQGVQAVYDNIFINLGINLATIFDGLKAADSVIGYDDVLANDSFEKYLSVQNLQVLNDAKLTCPRADKKYTEANDYYHALSTNPSHEQTDEALDKVDQALGEVDQCLYLTRQALDNSIITFSFQQSQLDMLIGSVDGAKAGVRAAMSGLEALKQALDNTKNMFELAQKDYESALENLETVKVQAENQIAASENMVKTQQSGLAAAEAELALRKSDPREVDLASLKASVKEAQASYSLIANGRNKAFIKAPFSGTISTINVEFGELAGPSQTLVSMINPTGLQVKVFLNDKDVRLINEGSQVVIEDNIKGVVTKVAPAVDNVTKKIEVLIAISEIDPNIIIGQFVHAKIQIMDEYQEKGLYFLPLSAIKITPDNAYVLLVNDENKIEKNEITLGKVIGEMVEVTSGLNNEMKIISSSRGLAEGDEVKFD